MKILFMGTPEFSVFTISALHESGENIIGVVTQPDKPTGRKYKLTPSPVKLWAAERGIPVYQPTTLRGEEFATLLSELDPELIVVVAYGKILPQNVLDYPRYGCINVHGSLLPEYRGAAPIQRAIIEGKTKTGVTIIQMDAGIDTGDMLLCRELEIGEGDNFGILHDKLGKLGAAALTEAVALLKDGKLTRTPQPDTGASYAAKIEKRDCKIDFNKPARDVHNLIRGLSPAPLAFTRLPDRCMLKINEAEVAKGIKPCGARPGKVIALDHGIVVACAEGAVRFLRVLPECKCCMCSADYIRGRKICTGDLLS